MISDVQFAVFSVIAWCSGVAMSYMVIETLYRKRVEMLDERIRTLLDANAELKRKLMRGAR